MRFQQPSASIFTINEALSCNIIMQILNKWVGNRNHHDLRSLGRNGATAVVALSSEKCHIKK